MLNRSHKVVVSFFFFGSTTIKFRTGRGRHAKKFGFKRNKPAEKISDKPVRGHHKLHWLSIKSRQPPPPSPYKKSTVPYSNYLHVFLCTSPHIYASSTFRSFHLLSSSHMRLNGAYFCFMSWLFIWGKGGGGSALLTEREGVFFRSIAN